MARNKNAGKIPSYKKRNMSKKAHDNKKEYDKKYSSTQEQSNKRNELNKNRRKFKKAGKNVEGKDVSHTKNGLRLKTEKANRGSKTDSAGDRRARGKGVKKGKRTQ